MDFDEICALSQHFINVKNKSYQRYFLKFTELAHRFSILLGPRGVGKTTILIQYLLQQTDGDKQDPSILYVQADHFVIQGTSLYEIAEQHHKLGGKFIAFDEIHKYNNWSIELKSIYDTFPDLKIIASGSSALEIYKGSHDLSRRSAIYNIAGLSLREFLELELSIELPHLSLPEIINNHERLATDIIDTLTQKDRKILSEFKTYLQIGYYPYFQEIQNYNVFFMTLEQNLHTTIESDLAAIHPALSGHTIKKLKQLLAFIAANVPFIPNIQKIKTLLDIGDQRTLKTYFKYLEDAGVIRTVMKSSNKLNKLEAPAKIYLNDPNQFYAIAPQRQNHGTIREIFFLCMLSQSHELSLPANGDFLVDDKYTFEIGGKKKNFNQIKEIKDSYLACDDIEAGFGNKIPLWLFGFLY